MFVVKPYLEMHGIYSILFFTARLVAHERLTFQEFIYCSWSEQIDEAPTFQISVLQLFFTVKSLPSYKPSLIKTPTQVLTHCFHNPSCFDGAGSVFL